MTASSVREAGECKPDSSDPARLFKNSSMAKEHRESPPAGQEWGRQGRTEGKEVGDVKERRENFFIYLFF